MFRLRILGDIGVEVWQNIEDYEDLYQISNNGRVKSFWYGKEKILIERVVCGYLQVTLCKNGIQKQLRINRLVAQAFIPNPHNYPQVNHRNENKSDNRVENLEWCTAQYNNTYGTRTKRIAKANTNGKLSKPIRQYSLKEEFINEFPSLREVERQTGYFHDNISKCCKGTLKTAYGYIWRYAVC